jgi:hypothetical protein
MWWRRLRYVLLLITLCAIATCPAAKRSCTAKTRAAEADELLGYLADRVAAEVAATGRVPPTAAGPTPAPACCDQAGRDGVCAPDAAVWAAPGWQALGFSIDGPYRYTYQYTPDPGGLSATLRAVGDLACEGRPDQVEVRLTVVGGKLSRVRSRRPSPALGALGALGGRGASGALGALGALGD